MRYSIIALLALNLILVSTVYAAAPRDTVLIRLEQRWLEAIQSHDTVFLNELLADDFTDISVHGEIRHKQDVLTSPVAPHTATQQLSDMTVRTYGDTAVVTGLNTLTSKQPAWTAQVHFTDVFIRHDGHWQAVSAQETLVSPPKN